ncbi:MAG TPA: hypothetical protein ENI08_00375 [Candidatus Dependentiae bacterium]|nr:hypothetical protein [Candidatus Dependentiae bacterium]
MSIQTCNNCKKQDYHRLPICPDCYDEFRKLQTELDELKAERQKAIAAGGYSAWTGKHILNLETEVTQLKERITFAMEYLPECPDRAMNFLGGVR